MTRLDLKIAAELALLFHRHKMRHGVSAVSDFDAWRLAREQWERDHELKLPKELPC